jgi:hypothetical protein
MRTGPDPDAASNLALTNSFPKTLREDHDESLHLTEDGMLLFRHCADVSLVRTSDNDDYRALLNSKIENQSAAVEIL